MFSKSLAGLGTTGAEFAGRDSKNSVGVAIWVSAGAGLGAGGGMGGSGFGFNRGRSNSDKINALGAMATSNRRAGGPTDFKYGPLPDTFCAAKNTAARAKIILCKFLFIEHQGFSDDESPIQ
jgi:hypothetical protein